MCRNLTRWFSASILAVGLCHLAAQAQDVSALRNRLGQLREHSYLAPKATLAELQKLRPQVAKWPQSEQARYFSLVSNTAREVDSKLALAAAAEEERIGRALGDDAIVASSLVDRVYVQSSMDDMGEVSKNVALAFELAGKTNDPAILVKTTITAGQDEIRRGNGRKGLEYIDRAVALANSSGQAILQFAALRARAYALSGLAGRGPEALKAIDELKAKAGAIPFDGPATRARLAEYQIADDAGQLARAREALTDVVIALQKRHMEELVPDLQVTLADLSLRTQDYREALRLSRESKVAARAIDDTMSAEISQFNEGIALIYMGQLEEGRAAIEASNEEFIDAEALFEYARALDYVGQKEFALKVYARATRKAGAASAAKAQQQKESHEKEELLRRAEENLKESHNQSKLQRAWSVAAALALLGLAVVAYMFRKLRAANARLEKSGS
ncbi:hypothetical protein ABT364_00820 [Massilia sp. SR12]